MAKISRPVMYTALAAVVAAAWLLTSEEPAKAKGKTTPKRTAAATKDKMGFLPEDYNPPTFEPVMSPVPSKFNPLVVRTQTASALALAPDAVPAELAGGDPNWVYTGTAEIDGKPTALLENRVTAESDFVNQGQKWKRCEVAQILPQGIVLAGPSGRKVKLVLSSGDSVIGTGSERFASGFRPVNPALSGPIGNGIRVRPDSTATRNGLETRDAN